MHFLLASLYYNHPGFEFSAERVVENLRVAFPNVTVAEDDPLLTRAQNTETYLDRETDSGRHVLNRMWQDAKEQGPARNFTIRLGDTVFHGLVKRHVFQVKCESPISNDQKEIIKEFIRSLLPIGNAIVIDEAER